jgi:FAD/FMN-containing dehydrogenase
VSGAAHAPAGADPKLAELAAALTDIVGPAHVLREPDVKAGYESDITGRYGGSAALVVRPADTAEVTDVLDACWRLGAAVVPQGGNTGLVGGGVPRGGEVVLSLTRLSWLGDLDAVAGQISAGAGATLGALQEQLRGSGWAFGVDYGARDGATLGGMAATNAGGMHVMRHGSMRAQVVGLEAVLGNGAIVSRLSGVIKDNAGLDLSSLLVGSEGTLGVITALRLRLVAAMPTRIVALMGLPDTATAMTAMQQLRARVRTLQAVEVFYREGLELVRAHRRLPDPLPSPSPVYVLAECAATDEEPLAELAEALDGIVSGDDVVIADDTAGRRALWTYRESHNEAINAQGVPHKLDVCVPLARLADFESEVRELIATHAPAARTILYGHLGDGNLHVNILGLEPDDEATDEAVLRLAAAYGGTISAEHGIGAAKPHLLHLCRRPDEISAMRALKSALDPDGLLNPGKLFRASA